MNQEEYIVLWIKKAEGDLKVAKRELRDEYPVLDAVCFHLQQAVEKYLKGFLIKSRAKLEKTHNIEFLIEECIRIDKGFEQYEEKFDAISQCGVEIRYPDSFIAVEMDEMLEMVAIVDSFKKFVLDKLGINLNKMNSPGR